MKRRPQHTTEPEPREPHQALRDLCFQYRSWNRSAFAEEIRNYIASASSAELTALRRAISERQTVIDRQPKKRGRPKEEHSAGWILGAARVAWCRHVEHLSWRQIAARFDMSPTRPNIRTLTRKRDDFAEDLFDRLRSLGANSDGSNLKAILSDGARRGDIEKRFALPFDQKPGECESLVKKLFLIGSNPQKAFR